MGQKSFDSVLAKETAFGVVSLKGREVARKERCKKALAVGILGAVKSVNSWQNGGKKLTFEPTISLKEDILVCNEEVEDAPNYCECQENSLGFSRISNEEKTPDNSPI